MAPTTTMATLNPTTTTRIRSRCVFVDPQITTEKDRVNEKFWWPALVVPRKEWAALKRTMAQDDEEFNLNNKKLKKKVLVCYFEDASYSFVEERDLKSFNPRSPPYTDYMNGAFAEEFVRRPEMQLATYCWANDFLPEDFRWIYATQEDDNSNCDTLSGRDNTKSISNEKQMAMSDTKKNANRKSASLNITDATPPVRLSVHQPIKSKSQSNSTPVPPKRCYGAKFYSAPTSTNGEYGQRRDPSDAIPTNVPTLESPFSLTRVAKNATDVKEVNDESDSSQTNTNGLPMPPTPKENAPIRNASFFIETSMPSHASVDVLVAQRIADANVLSSSETFSNEHAQKQLGSNELKPKRSRGLTEAERLVRDTFAWTTNVRESPQRQHRHSVKRESIAVAPTSTIWKDFEEAKGASSSQGHMDGSDEQTECVSSATVIIKKTPKRKKSMPMSKAKSEKRVKQTQLFNGVTGTASETRKRKVGKRRKSEAEKLMCDAIAWTSNERLPEPEFVTDDEEYEEKAMQSDPIPENVSADGTLSDVHSASDYDKLFPANSSLSAYPSSYPPGVHPE